MIIEFNNWIFGAQLLFNLVQKWKPDVLRNKLDLIDGNKFCNVQLNYDRDFNFFFSQTLYDLDHFDPCGPCRNLCNGIDVWTGPPERLSLSSVMLVDKVRLPCWERKNTPTHILGQRFVCLSVCQSVTNFDLNYLRTG